MAVQKFVDADSRLVLGVFTGNVSFEELAGFAKSILTDGLQGYAKLFEVVEATPQFEQHEFLSLLDALGTGNGDPTRGPIAVVVHRERGALARLFTEQYGAGTETEADSRPVKVFHSIHEARRWLAEEHYRRSRAQA
jgi:hypothetical protein